MEAKRDCPYLGCKSESCTLYDKDDRTYSCEYIRNRGECPIQEGVVMASKNETVEEVCGELKEVANGNNVSNDGLVVEISQVEIWGALDRIGAAHKREVEELKKLLKEVADCADEFQKFFETHPYLCKYTRDIVKKSRKALEGAK